MEQMTQSSDTIKNTVDLVAIPGGIVAAIGNYIGVINGLLTMIVLLTSIGWGVYRIIEIHRKLYPK